MTGKSGASVVRFLTMLVMVLSLIGMTFASASAAPGGPAGAPQAQAQTVEECTLLLESELINAEGEVVSPETFAADLLAADITLDADTIDAVLAGECAVVLGPGTSELTADICLALLGEELIDAEGNVAADVAEDDIVAFLTTQGITLSADALILLGQGGCGDLLPPGGGDDTTDGIDGDDTVDGGDDTADGTDGTDEPGTLVISKFECTQIEEPTATVSDPVGVGAAVDEPVVPEEGCVPDAADFQIFVNSDFTSDPIDVFVDGTATVNGVPSTAATGVPNALFEPAFNVFFEFDITPGGVTTITVLNPADDGDGATPIADSDDDGGTGDDGGVADGKDDGGTGDDGAADDGGTAEEPVAGEQDEANEVAGEDDDDGATGGAAADDDDGDVSGLPSTGQGSDGGANGSAIVLLFGAMSMVALAAGFAWRQRSAS